MAVDFKKVLRAAVITGLAAGLTHLSQWAAATDLGYSQAIVVALIGAALEYVRRLTLPNT